MTMPEEVPNNIKENEICFYFKVKNIILLIKCEASIKHNRLYYIEHLNVHVEFFMVITTSIKGL